MLSHGSFILFLFQAITIVAANRWALNGKNIVVTGGTKGIGKAVVEECLELCGRVFTCARNDAELNALLDAFKSKGYDIAGIVADVSKEDDRIKLVI